jgi:hypothetical protein
MNDVTLRLLASVVALSAGVAAVVVAVLLFHDVVG